MNDIALTNDHLLDDLQSRSTPDLWREFSSVLEVTAVTLTRLALIAGELQRRGEDLSDLRSGLASYLPLIASKRLSAEAVVKFAGQRTILNAVMSLPVQTQRELAAGEPVQVVTLNGRGETQALAKRVHELTVAQVKMVFDGRIRTVEEQERYLASLRKRRDASRGRRRVNRTASGRFARQREDTDAIAEALATLPEIADDPECKAVLLKLGADEHQQLKANAVERRMSMQALVRAALAAAGLI